MKLLKGKRLRSDVLAGFSAFLRVGVLPIQQASVGFRGRKRVEGKWQLRLCYSPPLDADLETEERSAPCGKVSGPNALRTLAEWP